jgi:hypothetical protein
VPTAVGDEPIHLHLRRSHQLHRISRRQPIPTRQRRCHLIGLWVHAPQIKSRRQPGGTATLSGTRPVLASPTPPQRTTMNRFRELARLRRDRPVPTSPPGVSPHPRRSTRPSARSHRQRPRSTQTASATDGRLNEAPMTSSPVGLSAIHYHRDTDRTEVGHARATQRG